ncbi:Flagellar motor switch protein FliM (plasmid) [Rhodovastum atsumiense]|uniref:FliM/FliN family flagellar motor switch protein n=1 Tax=Rhodovastum atsumiense TaxID=504468 RepID=UPI0020247C27|nr:FliM/FliN family flagellar motor switch protein [Rhodovastum atsumiense]CAH2605534.1 Flagellar motor switch protein FliM [Rhodovastum atsumiense]
MSGSEENPVPEDPAGTGPGEDDAPPPQAAAPPASEDDAAAAWAAAAAAPASPAAPAPEDDAADAWAAAAGGKDDADAWAAAAGSTLGQSDIDDLFGGSAAAEKQTTRTGFEALVGGAVVGIDRLPMLNMVVDRLARRMTTSIRKFTADNADVSIERIRPVRLKEFLDSIALPAMIAVIRIEQWDGYCLAALDSRLIASVVDVLLGGRRNRVQPIDGRPYTPIERTFVGRLIEDVITRDLKHAFESICEVDFSLDRFEGTPSYAAITKLTAAAVTFRAEVLMDGRGGHIDFLIPYATLEPVRDVLSQEFVGKKQGGDSIWRSHLMEEIPRAHVRLRVVLGKRQLSSAEVARWRLGSRLVLDCRHDDPIDVFCDDLLVLRARIAEKDGRVALRVEERHILEDWPGPAA